MSHLYAIYYRVTGFTNKKCFNLLENLKYDNEKRVKLAKEQSMHSQRLTEDSSVTNGLA